jgi:hypothetical protein
MSWEEACDLNPKLKADAAQVAAEQTMTKPALSSGSTRWLRFHRTGKTT